MPNIDDEAVARGIYNKISTNATVLALSSNVYFVLAPEGTVFPYITFWFVTGNPKHNQSHDEDTIERDIWQIDIRDDDLARINQIDTAIVDGFKINPTLGLGTLTEMRFIRDTRIGIRPESLGTTGKASYVKSVTYVAWYHG